MTLQQLQYIVAVADTGQFSKAARRCHVTQPTLTMMVRKLEDELGVILFERRVQPARHIGILAGPVEAKDLEVITLFNEPFLAYLPAGHALLRVKRIMAKNLRNEPLWVLSEGHCLRDQVLAVCQQPSAAGHVNIQYSTGSIETLKRMVANGGGITLVPELAVREDEGNVRRFSGSEPMRAIVLVMRRPFVRRKVLDALTQAIKQAVPEQFLEHVDRTVPTTA
jgi:LysR family hydrogen peroxide-inducible transcriptional activator